MIFSFFIKNAKYILDGLLVAGLVVAFFYWDPFGVFGTRLKLQNTANLVTGVRDIGQLVTAEYYGEVIASWRESKLEEIPSDTLNELADDLFVDVKTALYYLYQLDTTDKVKIKIRRKKMDELVFQGDPEIKSSFLYPYLISFLGKNVYLKEEKKRTEANLLWAMYLELLKNLGSVDKTYEYLNTSINSGLDFTTYYRGQINEEIEDKRRTRRKELTFIGRGTVKAGFDFGRLDESRFVFDEDRGVIYFFGLKPEILDADINPWFIPERKIPGFQLVSDRGKLNFEDAILVKKRCKEKLREQALGAGILESADEYGKETLKRFFSLLTGTEIKEVVLRKHRLAYYYDEIAKDSLVDIGEITLIDSLYRNELRLIESESTQKLKEKKIEHLSAFLKKIQMIKALDPVSGINFNYFFRYSRTILDDVVNAKQIDSTEWGYLVDLRKSLTFMAKDTLQCDLSLPAILFKDSLWFEDRASYAEKFNEFIYSFFCLVDSMPPGMVQKAMRTESQEMSKILMELPAFQTSRALKFGDGIDSITVDKLHIPISIERSATDSVNLVYTLDRVIPLPGKNDQLIIEYLEKGILEMESMVLSDLLIGYSKEDLEKRQSQVQKKPAFVHNPELRLLRDNEQNAVITKSACIENLSKKKEGNLVSRFWNNIKSLRNGG